MFFCSINLFNSCSHFPVVEKSKNKELVFYLDPGTEMKAEIKFILSNNFLLVKETNYIRKAVFPSHFPKNFSQELLGYVLQVEVIKLLLEIQVRAGILCSHLPSQGLFLHQPPWPHLNQVSLLWWAQVKITVTASMTSLFFEIFSLEQSATLRWIWVWLWVKACYQHRCSLGVWDRAAAGRVAGPHIQEVWVTVK